ncbi:MAG TPA: SulP family inorganic anion transporter [Gemmataceae bacterium]|nr:SulP family inorganic anion transporter [Gemmataceae bacterium]
MVPRDLTAGLVVFVVALPLCLGVALTVGDPVPLVAGILTGIVGGIVVGLLSGSNTSVSGPSPALTAVIAAQVALLGSFDAFLLALFFAGLIQIALGFGRAGFLSAFFPSSVIKGLLSAVGVLLILKQVPHVLGHDTDPVGDMSFEQPRDHENTFTALLQTLYDLHPGAAIIGLVSIGLLVMWEYSKFLKRSGLPAPLVVVAVGIVVKLLFDAIGGAVDIESSHLVNVPMKRDEFLTFPDFAQWTNPSIYTAALTIAVVASLETLLNLSASDKIDPRQRQSPPNRELIVQGVGNALLGLIGGIPMTSAIVRSSINIGAGAQSKLASITHGILLAGCVLFLPFVLNQIPLSCLGAILVFTGIRLASPAMIKRMWQEGPYQFIPFIATMIAIVCTDLLRGILIGLGVGILFILNSNLRKPVRRVVEKHLGGDVLHIQFASQVSFLNRAALEKILHGVPRGGHVLLDASNTEYIDPDVLDLIRDFREEIAPAHGVQVSVRGFREKYRVEDDIQYIDYSTRELQDQLSAAQVLQILKDGNERFRAGRQLTRDLNRQVDLTSKGQHPLAVILSCIDSRTPAEIIFDLGLGDIFSVRVAGNVISANVLGSMEYGCAVAGAKLILVVGHTRCGAVTAAVDLACSQANPGEATGCQNIEKIITQVQQSVTDADRVSVAAASGEEKANIVDAVARRNVRNMVEQIQLQSQTIRDMVQAGKIAVMGAMYDIRTGVLEVLSDDTAIKSEERE